VGDYDGLRRPSAPDAQRVGDVATTSTPGKVPLAAVQRRAAGPATVDPGKQTASEIALRGTSGAGGALPYLDRIQASFGRHDVSQVRAHTGAATDAAASSLGARAFAHGNAIGFAGGTPDLHTAAHEAAHVVQQRAGVSLAGGLDGGASDPYERHADAVADAVVRGQSAEAMLGAISFGGSSRAVQRKNDPPQGELPKQSKEDLLHGKNYQVLSDGSMLVNTDWLTTAKDASWQGDLLSAPAEVAELLTAMKAAGILSWMDSAQIPDLSTKIGVGQIDPASETCHIGIEISVYFLIGPPPGRDVIVGRNGGDLIIVIRQSLVSSGPVPGQEVNLTAPVREEVLTAAEKYTKLKMDPGLRNQVVNGGRLWTTAVDPSRQGTIVTITQPSAETLFGQQKYQDYLKQPPKSGSGAVSGDGKLSKEDDKPHWVPKGNLALDPLQPKYMTKSNVTVEMQWDFTVHPDAGFVLLPNHCDYKWTVKKNGKVVDDSSSGLGLLSDNRSTKLQLDGDPGTYEISLVATSDHFLTKDHQYTRSITLQAISEKDFDQQEFDAELKNSGPFTRDPGGALHLKKGALAATPEANIHALEATESAISSLKQQGKLSGDDYQILHDQLEKQKAELETVKTDTKGGEPYVVFGTFVGREDSSSMKLDLLMHRMTRKVTGNQGWYSVLLHDMTLGDPSQHPGAANGPIAADTDAEFAQYEKLALDLMADDFHAHNDLPNGTVHLSAQMKTSGVVWQATRDTDNGRKETKKWLGRGAMVAGGAAMLVPGADVVASAPLITLGLSLTAAGATATMVAIDIEDHWSQTGHWVFDRRVALDVLQLVAVSLPLGTMTKAFANLTPVAKTGMFLAMFGIDAAQAVLMTQDVRDQLRLIDANANKAIGEATTEEQKQKIRNDRDRKIAEVLGAAMVNAGFILVSLGGGLKRLAETTRTGIPVQIAEPVMKVREGGRATMEETLNRNWYEHENERVLLTDDERTFLEQEVNALKKAEGDGGGGGKDNGKGGGKNNDHGGGGSGKDNKGGKPPEPDAQTASDLKKYADAEQRQVDMQAVKDGTATKEQRERLAEALKKQVPDIGLVDAVHAGTAKTVISVVTPGGGDFGIKRMNDELISYQFNSNRLIPGRNKIIKDAFESQGFKVVDQNYKTTTFVSDKAPADTTAGMDAAAKLIDPQMKKLIDQVLDEATQHFKQQLANGKLSPDEIKLAKARVEKMAALKRQIDAQGKDFHFDFQMGAAEIKGGPNASYEDILGSEMDATKAALMARDKTLATGAGGRAMVFDDAQFLAYAKETVAIKEGLKGKTLPYHGERLQLFDGEHLNRDILRAVRKNSYNEKLGPEDIKTLNEVNKYFQRVNSLDYVKHFTGDEVGGQGQKVADTAALIKQLESDKPLSKEAADAIQDTLTKGTPQDGAATEAEFFAKAATVHDRVVLNADIKDMGLDLFAGYEDSLDKIGTDPKANMNSVSQHASDPIVEFKRRAAETFKNYYRDTLLPEAKAEAVKRNRQDLLDILNKEPEPLMLLGGDEITVSLPKAFQELGLVPKAVAKLTSPEVANARVAVTSTGDGPGAAGHVAAMKASQGGQDILKKNIEPLARELRAKSESLPPEQAAPLVKYADRMDGMYMEERSGKNQLMEGKDTRDPKEVETTAKGLIDSAALKIPDTVPKDGDELRAMLTQKYPEAVGKYSKAPRTQKSEYLALIEEIKQYKPGELGKPENRAKSKDIMDRYLALGDKTQAKDIRDFYEFVEQVELPFWQKDLENAGISKEVRARLANMHRAELRKFVREDMMTDDNSREFLYLRDLAIYGHRDGPTFDELMAKNAGLDKNEDQSFDAIIDSSQRPNKDVSGTINNNAGSQTDAPKKDNGSQ